VGRILRSIILAVAVLAALPVASASARPGDLLRAKPQPWATVNVCDTAGHPDGVGVRGWMPGAGGSKVALQMRLRLQYRRGHAWVTVRGADSRWLTAGVGRPPAETGQTFTVTPPRPGRAFVLRGVVLFRWRAPDGTVLRSVRKITHAGHAGTAGADPVGASSATCTVR
jgi:hypothetical protein